MRGLHFGCQWEHLYFPLHETSHSLVNQTRFLTWQFQVHDNGICHTSWSQVSGNSKSVQSCHIPLVKEHHQASRCSRIGKSRLHLLIRRIVNYKRVCQSTTWILYYLGVSHIDDQFITGHRHVCLETSQLIFFSYTPGLIIMRPHNHNHPAFNHEIHTSLP